MADRPPGIERYGKRFPVDWDAHMIECFMYALPEARRGPEALAPWKHFIKAIDYAWPKMAHPEHGHNKWFLRRIRGFTEYRFQAWTGAAACGKTHDAAVIAMNWWAMDPGNSAVILTSTTSKMVRKRIWPVIGDLAATVNKKCRVFADGYPGDLVDSQTLIRYQKGDDKHGVFALAVTEGPMARALANIQGIHADRLLLIVDEATDTPEAILAAVPNIRKGCPDFHCIVIGNASSTFDPHGRACEPRQGWDSVSVDDDEWETKPVPKWDMDAGICLHFDGFRTPNSGTNPPIYPFLFSEQDLERVKNQEDGEDTAGFWKFARGFWSQSGASDTIFNEQMIREFGGLRTDMVFEQSVTKIAALDPGFGGDKCVLKFAKLGRIEGRKMGIQLYRTVIVPVVAKNPRPKQFQIADKVEAECAAEGVSPKHLAVDSSGEGGVWSALAAQWSPLIVQVNFGAGTSTRPVSNLDQRRCCDVYDRFVTEMWFQTRKFLMGRQLAGLNGDDVIQFCGRRFKDRTKKSIERKDECRVNLGRSPDDADAVTIIVELARQLGAVAEITPGSAWEPEDKAPAGEEEFNSGSATWEDSLQLDEQVF